MQTLAAPVGSVEGRGQSLPSLKYPDGLMKVCGGTDGNHRRAAGNDGSVGMSVSVLTEERWEGPAAGLASLCRDGARLPHTLRMQLCSAAAGVLLY